MVALTGERYGEIANAFRYRSEYVEGCACKPKPWSAEAKVMFDRRAVLATRTPNEEIVAAGTGEVAKLLGAEGHGSRHESQAEIWPGDDRAAALPLVLQALPLRLCRSASRERAFAAAPASSCSASATEPPYPGKLAPGACRVGIGRAW
jgi:hypothetical protein